MPETLTSVFSLAGSDTTASAIRATMLHLVTNPPVLSKLLAELAGASISDPIKDVEARNLPYLQAVIKEGLRIHPPVTGLMSKDVPMGGDTINGYFVPAGTKIGYCAYGLFWDTNLWGDDARVFRPERWLEGSPEEIRRKEANMDLVFGYGRWQCLGRSIALIELNKTFVQVRRICEKRGSMKKCVGVSFGVSWIEIRLTRAPIVAAAAPKFRHHDFGPRKAMELVQRWCLHGQRHVDADHEERTEDLAPYASASPTREKSLYIGVQGLEAGS
jgi:hypothetical protein